ncbi:MAG: Elongation factor P [Candidatus Jorgensenbacteria bacterium GW2011_GWB1_49_9]|nr:MAG: Elongation factor P [Candidatus Jorgensenbacteria bacterium GW2011_GWB1_49_9]
MLSYNELTKGTLFILEGAPYEVLEMNFLRMQQRKATVNTKIRNLITGKVLDRNWQGSDSFEEAEIERKNSKFLYANRGEYWFCDEKNAADRFSLSEEVIGDPAKFLKPNTPVIATIFKDKVIKVTMPIKMDFKVIEAPPSIKGNTAQGGNKVITLEGGATINAPLFINEGDMVKVNTETGEYVERADKGFGN